MTRKPFVRLQAESGAATDHHVCSSMIETLIMLPKISPQKTLISVVASVPSSAIAGTPFPYHLNVSNSTSLPEDLQLWVHDADGCLYAGESKSKTVVLPYQSEDLTLEVLPMRAGMVKLPNVKITSPRMNCWVDVEGSELFVMPLKV